MLTLLSTLISFLMGGLPKLLEFFRDRQDKRHEVELARMQIDRELQMAERGFMAQAKLEEIKLDEIRVQSDAQKYLADSQTRQAVIGAQQAEMAAVYDYSKSLGDGVSPWVKNLRGSTQVFHPRASSCCCALSTGASSSTVSKTRCLSIKWPICSGTTTRPRSLPASLRSISVAGCLAND